MTYYCGIDIGASTAKLVVIDTAGQIMGKAMARSGIDYAQTAQALLTDVCTANALDRSHIARS